MTDTFTQPVPFQFSSLEGIEKANEYVQMPREHIAMGTRLSDFELANAIFLANRNDLSLIGLQTAAKERIRWLSAQLALRDQLIREWAAERKTFLSGETPKLREISERLVNLVDDTLL